MRPRASQDLECDGIALTVPVMRFSRGYPSIAVDGGTDPKPTNLPNARCSASAAEQSNSLLSTRAASIDEPAQSLERKHQAGSLRNSTSTPADRRLSKRFRGPHPRLILPRASSSASLTARHMTSAG